MYKITELLNVTSKNTRVNVMRRHVFDMDIYSLHKFKAIFVLQLILYKAS